MQLSTFRSFVQSCCPPKITKESFSSRIAITILFFLGLTFWTIYSVYFLNQKFIYAENGPLENTQVLTLSIASLVFLLSVLCQERKDKLFQLFFSLLCLSFVLREVDVEDLNVPNILVSIGSGNGRNVMLTIGFVAIFFCISLNIVHYKKVLKFYILSKEGFLIVAAGILLCVGTLFEEMSWVAHHTFIEEILELSGYVIILLVAFLWSKNGLTKHPDGHLQTRNVLVVPLEDC